MNLHLLVGFLKEAVATQGGPKRAIIVLHPPSFRCPLGRTFSYTHSAGIPIGPRWCVIRATTALEVREAAVAII